MHFLKRCLFTEDRASYNEFRARIRMLESKRAFTESKPCITVSTLLNSLVGKRFGRLVRGGLEGRSELIASQVSPYIAYRSDVLDFGCGDGKVAEVLARRANITLTDVVDYNKTGMKLHLFDGRLTFPDCSFDSVLLLTVLHHANDPLKVLNEAIRVTRDGGRIIVIESTYFNQPHKALNRFMDWFYNKVLNDPSVPVPWNFMTPGGWNLLFSELGLKLLDMRHLGVDQPLVPEWHILYVLEKKP